MSRWPEGRVATGASPASIRDASLPMPLTALPPGFVDHEFGLEFGIEASRPRVWSWLEAPDTFVRGQIWPFRVEFLSVDPGVPAGFHVGGLNLHHGPLLSFAGVLTEIREPAYRDLRYFYGSYVLSLRVIRPTRLEFWVEEAGSERARVRLRVESQVRRSWAGAWTRAQRLFWRRFPRWMARSLAASLTLPGPREWSGGGGEPSRR